MVDGQALASQNRSFAKKLLQKTEVLCKFASKQEVLTNCCKIETLQPKKIAAKESYLKFASNLSHSHKCVTLSFV